MPVKVSIVVPIYNVERYLEQCLDSIVAQTLEDIEIICINDGSTDCCGDILSDYVARDARFNVVTTANQGLANARREGVVRARGLYIGFVDSDDWIEPDMYELMFREALGFGADLVECNIFASPENDDIYIELKQEFVEKVVRTEILGGGKACVVWNKIYRNLPVIRNFDFGVSPCEDFSFNIQYFSLVERYRHLPFGLYHYRVTPGSLSRRYNENAFCALKSVHSLKRSFFPEYGFSSNNDLIVDRHWFFRNLGNILRTILLTDRLHVRKKYFLFQEVVKDEHIQVELSHLSSSGSMTFFEWSFFYPRLLFCAMFMYVLALVLYKYIRKM